MSSLRLCLLPLFTSWLHIVFLGLPPSAQAMNLQSAVQEALKTNFDILLSDHSTQEKSGSLTQSKGDFDWNTSLSYTYDKNVTPTSSSLDGTNSSTRAKDNIVSFTLSKTARFGTKFEVPYSYTVNETNSSTATLSTSHTPVLGFNVTQPLIKSFTPSYFVKDFTSADFEKRIAQKKHGEKIVATLSKVIGLYLDAMKERRSSEIKASSYELAKETYESVRQKVQAGKSSRIDLLEAEGSMKKNYESMLQAEADFKNKKDELALEVFGDPEKEFSINEVLGDPEEIKVGEGKDALEATIHQAEKKRLEPVRGMLSIDQARGKLDASQVDLYPTADLKGTVEYTGKTNDFSTSHSQITDQKFQSWSAELSLAYPLVGYASKGAIRVNELKLAQEKIKRLQLSRNIALEVRKNVRQLNTDWQRLIALKKVAEAESEKFQGQKRRHNVGKLSAFELTQSLEDKRKAELEYIKAKIGYLKSGYKLSEVRGTLLEDFGIKTKF